MERFITLWLSVMCFVLWGAIMSYSVQRAGHPFADQVVIQDIRQQLRR